jgi:hypothetical protein
MFTQLRHRKNITVTTIFDETMDKNPDSYYFISTHIDSKKGYLVELTEEEANNIKAELVEINRMISYGQR